MQFSRHAILKPMKIKDTHVSKPNLFYRQHKSKEIATYYTITTFVHWTDTVGMFIRVGKKAPKIPFCQV